MGIDLKNAIPVVEGVDGLERADQFSLSSATPVELETVYDDAKPAMPTLGGFLKGLITGESLPEDIQTYNIRFEEELQKNPAQRKIAKSLLLPEWEALQSIKSGVVSFLNKEPKPDNPFEIKDRSILEVPEIKKILTSPEYTGYFRTALKAGANLHFNNPTSPFFFMPEDIKNTLIGSIDAIHPDVIAGLTESAGDMLGLGAISGSMGLLERFANSSKFVPKVELPEIYLEGKGYMSAELKSINKVQSAMGDVIKNGSTDPFVDVMKQRKTWNISPQELNLWKGAHSEGQIQYGAGLPIPNNLIAKYNLTETQISNIEKGIMEGLPEALIGELTQKGISLPPGTEKAQPGTNLKGEIASKSLIGDVKGKERQFAKSIGAALPNIKVGGDYIPRENDELWDTAKARIEKDFNRAKDFALRTSSDEAVAVATQIMGHYNKIIETTADQAVKTIMSAEVADFANNIADKLVEAGRTVQAASLISKMTPEAQVIFAAKEIKKYNQKIEDTKGGFLGLSKPIPELTPLQTQEILTRMKEVQNMPEGDDKAIKFKELQDYISDLIPTPLMDKIVSVWKAGLLTGIQTTGVNVLANASHALSEIASDVPAALIDRIISIGTGQRTITTNVKGYGKGFVEGLQKGWRFLKTGYDERNVLSKYDYKKVNMGSSKFAKGLQKYEEFIFGLLGAEDQPFYYGAKLRSLYGQAKVQAINKGLKGKEAKAFIDDLVNNPTDDMLLMAIEDAKIAVFQNDTALGNIARSIQKTPFDIGQFILPFGKTPSAVATQIINYTPAGAIKTAITNMGKGKFNQREFSKGVGKGVGVGTTILGLGYWLYKQGLLNLDRPKTEAEQKLWELEGKSPNTIKVGDKYRQLQVLGPAGNVLLIGAHFARAFEKQGSVAGAMAEGLWGSLKSFEEQTFLQGVNRFLDALSDPQRSAISFVNSFAGSIVPTIVKNVAVATDKKSRLVRNPIEAIMERIPILRYMLEPKVDVFGQDIERMNNFFETMADPTRPSTMKEDTVTNEIRRLIDAKQEVQTSQLGKRMGYNSLTPEQNTSLWYQSGRVAYNKIAELMGYDNYSVMSDEKKATRINKIIQDSKDRAKLDIVMERTKGLEGDELTTVLKEMKKEGLLTQEIFKKLMRLR